MPQKFYIVESEDEIRAKNTGFLGGQEIGYKKGFLVASILWIFVFILYLFFTLQNISYLTQLRIKMSTELKAQIPQHTELIDKLIPDGTPEKQLEIIRASRAAN